MRGYIVQWHKTINENNNWIKVGEDIFEFIPDECDFHSRINKLASMKWCYDEHGEENMGCKIIDTYICDLYTYRRLNLNDN